MKKYYRNELYNNKIRLNSVYTASLIMTKWIIKCYVSK